MRTAYVTGADRGLGYELTKALLGRGCKVYAGQYMPEWEQLASLKGQYGKRLAVLPLDVSNLIQVNAAAEAIRAGGEPLDYVFNVAGIHHKDDFGTIFDGFGEGDYASMQRCYDVNALGPLRVTSSVLDLITKGEGKAIVIISSEAGSVGGNRRDGEYGYCMSKAALNMQSAILQHSVAHLGIKVLCLYPGWIRTYIIDGKLNEQATEDPLDVANRIVDMLGSQTHMNLASPMYMDYRGAPLPY